MLLQSYHQHPSSEATHKEVITIRDIVFLPELVLSKNMSDNIDSIAACIREHDKLTFNPMGDELNGLVSLINGDDNAPKPLALIELAEHLTTFDSYQFAYYTYRESILLCLHLSSEDCLLQDGLLGIAKILKGGHLDDRVSNSKEISKDIFKFLAEFENEEAMAHI
jgi:hypothetical protein